MADETPTPAHQLVRIYVKNLLLDQPNSPQILLKRAEPELDIRLGWAADKVAEGTLEARVAVRVTAQVEKELLFALEAHQAGVFAHEAPVNDAAQGQLEAACAQIVYGYLRATISDACIRAGFAPLTLAEVRIAQDGAQPSTQAGVPADEGPRIPAAYAASAA